MPVLKALVRSGKSEEQKKLSGQERRKNITNKFVVDYYGLANSDGVIPSNILASMFGFKPEELFKAESEEARKNVKVDFGK